MSKITGRTLDKDQALKALRKKGCIEEVIHLIPPKTVLVVPAKVKSNLGIKSWGLVDFLKKKMMVIVQ